MPRTVFAVEMGPESTNPRAVGPPPPVARAVSSNPESYVYLAESIQAWPGQRELASDLATAGWRDVEWTNLSAGIVALHRGIKL